MEIIYTNEAIDDIDNIHDYISKDNFRAADKLLNRIYNVIDLISKNPYIGVVGRVENTREFFTPYSNYFIVYTVDNNILTIVNIINMAKDY